MESPLPQAIVRNLGAGSYDKRKNAALEIEALIKQLQDEGDSARVVAIIGMLGQEFATSTNANHRKGGLIGLAATAIGLMGETSQHLNLLLPPVLHCFDDPESRVRYYACESLYNIAKVARGSVLQYFNQIFDGLCKLFADVDVDVKNGANLLDRLIKDVVTESESFDVDKFIPLLQKYIRMTNPFIRQLLVGWITVLDSVPDIDMLDWLPSFLDGLFNMLSDSNREIRQAADSALAEFLREIKATEYVEHGLMVSILVGQCNSLERFNRLTAITWVHEFILLGRERLSSFYSQLLSAVLGCISDAEGEIRQAAEQTNEDLLQLVRGTQSAVQLQPLVAELTKELKSHHVPTRTASLRWISMLLEKDADGMLGFVDELLPALLDTLSDDSDDVVLLDLEVCARIALSETQFQRVLSSTVQLFAQNRRLLDARGSLIIRRLCLLLDARTVFVSLASILADEEDLGFASLIVQVLNLILLTAGELLELRMQLKQSCQPGATPEQRELFTALFRSWSHNPVATFSLCLLAQAYELASLLVAEFADVDITVGFLMGLDKLVQLLESPIFIHLRLQLLETDNPAHPHLLKSLFGLLMLLPQSTAFTTLRDRLAAVSHLNTASGFSALQQLQQAAAATEPASPTKKGRRKSVSPPPSGASAAAADVVVLDHDALLAGFREVQERQLEARRATLRDRSFMS